ncbi:MAG: hypothetical protein Q8R98_07390, partial [Rubrivivax sp.]|nr:hypothetical protein [Rubrivivax sp.]
MTFPTTGHAAGKFTTGWPVLNTLSAVGAVALVTHHSPTTVIDDSTDTGSGDNVWVAGDYIESTGSSYRAQFFWCLNLARKSATHQIADSLGDVSYATVNFWIFDKAGTITVIDNTGAHDGTFGGPGGQPGSIDPGAENDTLWFAGGGFSNATDPRAISGAAFTVDTSNTECIAGHFNQATAAPLNPNVSCGGYSRWAVTALAIKAAAPVAPVITGPSGSAGAGSSTANLAENTTTGPVFSVSGSMSSPYPRITGTDAALFSLVNQGGGSYRVDKLVAGNYEAPDDAGANRVYNFVFEASASVSQSHALNLTDV